MGAIHKEEDTLLLHDKSTRARAADRLADQTYRRPSPKTCHLAKSHLTDVPDDYSSPKVRATCFASPNLPPGSCLGAWTFHQVSFTWHRQNVKFFFYSDGVFRAPPLPRFVSFTE